MTLTISHPTAPVAESLPAVPAVLGADLRVPLVTGGSVGYANFDHAASAPCLAEVRRAVDELLPWYASVHRGAGFASAVCTDVYEQARDAVRGFVGARDRDQVIFTRNSTDSLNLLARAVPRGAGVVLFDAEHHAALLPWRGPAVRRLRTPDSPADAVRAADAALRALPEGPRLLVVAGASNVTGELWPLAELAAAAHRHGARIAVDAAQLAPHRPIDVRALDLDYLVLSGHKLYAPFGAGVLLGRPDWLTAAQPYLLGGGATRTVTDRCVSWATGEPRHEAGSPNVVGAHALAAAAGTLHRNWPAVLAHEAALLRRLRAGLAAVPGWRELSLFGAEHDRVGVVSGVVAGQDVGLLAAALSAEHGIGVRDGAFCAHVITRRLVAEAGDDSGRALRISIGLGTTAEQVDRLVAALAELVAVGPRWTYASTGGRPEPTPDPRPRPTFPTL
jgi:selenocysteine lyase/cysteine desulfurase